MHLTWRGCVPLARSADGHTGSVTGPPVCTVSGYAPESSIRRHLSQRAGDRKRRPQMIALLPGVSGGLSVVGDPPSAGV